MVTSNQIKEAIKKHKLELPRYQKLFDYYIGKHKILSRKLPDKHKPNNKVVTLYPKKIINTMLGYFASMPLAYVSQSGNQNFLNDIKMINYLNNEEDTNAEIIKTFSIYGKCYELYFIDRNGNIRFNHYSPLEMYIERDSKNNILFGLRYWELKKDDNSKEIKVEVYDENGIYHFISSDGGNTYVSDNNENDLEHYFGEVPITIYLNNEEEQGDFEEIITQVDAINTLLSDAINSNESFVNAYLILAGYKATEKEDIEKMKQDGVLLLDDVGQAKFLTKDANAEFQNNLYETLDHLIHEQSDTPRLTSSKFSSNLSGQALKFHLFGLETKSSMKERKMEKALRKRIRMIVTMLNKQGKDYEPSDISFKFSRDIPADEAAITDQIAKLVNIVPLETLLSWHPKIQEPSLEIKKLKNGLDSTGLDADLRNRNQQILGSNNGAE
ncbi:phage portal protein [Halalkalibacter krulwichiae]|uniref:Phage portal protein, SPP1 Gp6-like n=1 Tax=Halalkalibacter krulwichiae TaxID=199441 RepID=A0A1X9MBL0_9BACI|nr:phage portal protein [Halalkalibacter krulwichiae]ARK30778.1 Phage portal protein, SPP1 Gp6-like [Halalkalibacter krulwichiae]